jgi:hypothetical protein
MKVSPRIYKGIEFITVPELPTEQRLLLESSPQTPERIKILIDGKIVDNCIQFKHYSEWYTAIYKTAVPQSQPEPVLALATATLAKN